jgi:hypothetical protein
VVLSSSCSHWWSRQSLACGNGTVHQEQVSWVIGEIESRGNQFVFASRVRSSTHPLESTAGADLAVRLRNQHQLKR